MFSFLYNTIFYHPLYNLLVFFTSVIPGNDVGIAVILLTITVKTIILPLSHKSVQAQKKLSALNVKITEIKEKYKDQQEQMAKIMALYKEHGVNPFSSIILLFVQLPIIIALYRVFIAGIDLASPVIYSFTPLPATVNLHMLGLFDLTQKSLILAIVVGITQFVQARLSVPPVPKPKKDASFSEEFAASMNMQTKYVLPVFIAFISYKLNTAVSIYWVVNNIYSIIHELFVKRKAEAIIAGTKN